jgi:hypothetical protein
MTIAATIRELEELEKKATPGRILQAESDSAFMYVVGPDGYNLWQACVQPGGAHRLTDVQKADLATFIAASVNSLPSLLSYIRALEAVAGAARVLIPYDFKGEVATHDADILCLSIALDNLKKMEAGK